MNQSFQLLATFFFRSRPFVRIFIHRRLRNPVLLARPRSQIEHSAPLAAKRKIRIPLTIGFRLADGTSVFHARWILTQLAFVGADPCVRPFSLFALNVEAAFRPARFCWGAAALLNAALVLRPIFYFLFSIFVLLLCNHSITNHHSQITNFMPALETPIPAAPPKLHAANVIQSPSQSSRTHAPS